MSNCPPGAVKYSWWELAKAIYEKWSADGASRLAAAFSYYAIFSIGPLLFIAVTLTSFIYGHKAADDQLRPQISALVGDKSAEFIQGLVAKAVFFPSLSFAGVVSIALVLYAATNLFVSLQDSLNIIFGVRAKGDRGWMGVVKDRALSFVMVLVVGVFILGSIALSTLTGYLHVGNAGANTAISQGANFLMSAVIFSAVFALLFKYLPDIRIDWRDTLVGAAATGILFSLARIGLGFYFAHSSIANPFGAAGSFVIVMLFVYYSSQIFFLGAAFTQVWACRSGDPINPAANAVAVKGAGARGLSVAGKEAGRLGAGRWERDGARGGWKWVIRGEVDLGERRGKGVDSSRWRFPAGVGWGSVVVLFSVAWLYFRRPVR